jgi:BCD family chlorophyll transporter-like MFS transporter
MTAYFMQELILEPYAGLVFGYSPGQSTQLSGAQNGGVFVGMLMVGIAATGLRIGTLRMWVMAGCLGSAAALLVIAALGQVGGSLLPAVVALGFFNGMFAVAAIGSMMALAGQGRAAREGTRMGLWGAAQAVAAGFGGLVGAAAADGLRLFTDAPDAFGAVFALEAALFCVAAMIAAKVIEGRGGAIRTTGPQLLPGE